MTRYILSRENFRLPTIISNKTLSLTSHLKRVLSLSKGESRDPPHPSSRACREIPENKTMDKIFSVYILANKRNGTLYIGVTSQLKQRVWQHKNKLVKGFSQKYNTTFLVYYETTPNVYSAIAREKQMKKWRREKKIFLIEKINPQWKDLYEDIV